MPSSSPSSNPSPSPSSSDNAPCVVGIDLGGTNMQVAVVDRQHAILGRHWCKTQPEQGHAAVIDRIHDSISHALKQAGKAMTDIAAVGLASPGAIDIPSGVVLASPNLHWTNLPLRDLLTNQLKTQVVLENDVNAAVWGEYQLGAGRDARDMLGVWVGTGVGGGLVLNGSLHHGTHFTAGEIGHSVILPDAPPGQRTVEDLCSRAGFARLLKRTSIDTAQLVAELDDGDPQITTMIHRAAELLGVAIANVVTILSLDSVIIGGGVSEALGQPFVDRIAASFRANVFPAELQRCHIGLTTLASDAGLLGSALLAMHDTTAR